MLNMLTYKGANATFKYSLEENIRLQNMLCLRWQATNLGSEEEALLRENKADGRKRTGKKENVVRNDPNPPGKASSAHR